MLDAQRLRSLLDYDPIEGIFTWRVSRSRTKAGSLAGRLANNGYVMISIDGREYLAHRLAWLYSNGEWPSAEVDHINRVKVDNRLANLRPATRQENSRNRKARVHDASGAKGVYWVGCRQKWRACIRASGKHYHLGYFTAQAEAVSAYANAAKVLHARFVPQQSD